MSYYDIIKRDIEINKKKDRLSEISSGFGRNRKTDKKEDKLSRLKKVKR